MCIVQQPSCRLCLAEHISEPYYFLLENKILTKKYSEVLNLETDLYDASILPAHICSGCQASLDQFIFLKKTFASNEKFLLKQQSVIKSKGLHEAKLQEYFKEDHVENADEVSTRNINYNLGTTPETEHFVEEKENNNADVQDVTQYEGGTQESEDKRPILPNDNQNRRECPKCPGKSFATSTFLNHIREVHNVGKHVNCAVDSCNVKFRKRGDMVRHLAVVHHNKKELCVDCGLSFKNLKYHRETVHQGLRYKCHTCDKEYKTEKMLRQHIETVHEKRRSICEICAVEVIDLKNHMKLNHEGPVEKLEPCPDENCDRKFRTSQEAKKHYKSFHLEIKEMCPICGGWFKALYQHTIAVHKNNKKHVCSDCGKAFSKKHDLMMHRNRVHLGIKYMCPQCGKQVSKLRDHIKLVHNVENTSKPGTVALLSTHKTISSIDSNSLENPLMSCGDPDDPSPVPNISDIIKRCVSNIEQQMVLPDGDTTGFSHLMDTVESESGGLASQLADFGCVYGSSQLPGLHTFRTKLEAGSHDLLAEDAVDTSASVETDTSNNINMYQWLESSE